MYKYIHIYMYKSGVKIWLLSYRIKYGINI